MIDSKLDLSEQENPYASPPISETLTVNPGEFELIGQRIVGPTQIVLPEVCVRCGEDAETGKRLKKTIKWAPIWIYFLLLIHPIIFLLVFLLLHQRCKVEYSLCEGCNRNRWIKLKVFWLLMSLACIWGLYCLFISFYTIFILFNSLQPSPLFNSETDLIIRAVLIAVLGIGSIIAGIFAAAPIRVKDYQKPVFFLSGAKPAFFEAMAKRNHTNE